MEKIALPSSLQDAEVTTLPESAYYIPEFLSVEEEQTLLDQVSSLKVVHCVQADQLPVDTKPATARLESSYKTSFASLALTTQ